MIAQSRPQPRGRIGVARLGYHGDMAEADKCVTIAITFDCPKGHEIVRTFPHIQAPGGHRIIEGQAFEALECPACGWKGTKRGNEAKGMKVL